MRNSIDLLRLYRIALRIRRVEERIAARYSEGKMRCPVHLSIGQEIPSAIFEQITQINDTAIGTHRAHAHYLAKGGDLRAMIAEIYGKVTGCSGGRGGSMHLIDLERGFLGSSAIVGNSIPVGVGSAYSHKLLRNQSVAFIFLGDGAVEEGVFYESANFAAVHNLPIVFICENNLYSVYTNLEPRQPSGRPIFKLAEQIGLNSKSCEALDYHSSFNVLIDIVESARAGKGPGFVEISTYRKLEHCGPNDDDNLGYRSVEELREKKDIDLLINLKSEILNKKLATEEEFGLMETMVSEEIDSAFKFAEESPFPSHQEVLRHVYA
jgi:TPP-dependent pyruvate/acetoin dehydrogenase alpha subunit